MGRTVRGINQTQHGIRLRITPDRGVPQPAATYRPKGGRPWLVLSILMVVLNRLGRHIQALIVLWNDYAIGNLPDSGPVGRETPAPPPAHEHPAAHPPNARPPNARARPEPLPSAQGWLEHLCRNTVVPFVAKCVSEPEMQAFVLAVPQAARHLRPICTALQIPIPRYLKQQRATPAPPPESEVEDSVEHAPPGPLIHKLEPNPSQAHPGWRNYVTIAGRLRA
jgi:hypothetical protein